MPLSAARLSPTGRRIGAGLAAIGWLVLGVAAVGRQLNARSADFREFYRVSRHLLEGEVNPGYTVPFTYPPAFHTLIAGFSWLPLGLAAALWFLFCSGAAALAAILLHRACSDGGPRTALSFGVPVAMGLGLVVNDLVMGNANLVVLGALALGLYLLHQGRDGAGGLALGAAAALKLTPLIFLGWLVYRLRLRAAAGMLGGLLLFGAVAPLVALGPETGGAVIAGWAAEIAPIAGGGGDKWYQRDDIYRGTNQSVEAVTHRLLRPVPAIRGQSPMGTVNVLDWAPATVRRIVWGLRLLILGGLALALGPPGRGGELPREFALVAIAMLLLSPVTWVNHLVHLSFAHFALAARLSGPHAHRARWALALAFGLSLIGATPLTQALAVPLLGALALAWGLSAR